MIGRHPGQRVVKRLVRSGSNPIGAPVAAMFRRGDFERSGGFSGHSIFAMDMDLWVRLLREGDFYGVPRSLASFRIRGGSTTALTSARSQLAQQTDFAMRVVNESGWSVSSFDRLVGRIKAYDGQLKRTLLFFISNRRTLRRRRAA